MDLGEQAHRVKFMIRDRGSNFTAAFDAVLAGAGIRTVLCNVRTPRMNATAERWIGRCRRELLDRTLVWNQAHLRRILHEYETHHNQHRPLAAAASLKPLPEPVDLDRYRVRRQAHIACLINEYRLVAWLGRGFGTHNAADPGDRDAARLQAELLARRGDLDQLRARADIGDRNAAWQLAELLARRGNSDGLRALAGTGDLHASRLLARRRNLDQLPPAPTPATGTPPSSSCAPAPTPTCPSPSG